jgi:hypothetical protein
MKKSISHLLDFAKYHFALILDKNKNFLYAFEIKLLIGMLSQANLISLK